MKYEHRDDRKYPHHVELPPHLLYEWDDDRMRVLPEVCDWLVEMVEMPYVISYALAPLWGMKGSSVIMFKDRSDAIKFKLAWA